jgi:hypothetical protein
MVIFTIFQELLCLLLESLQYLLSSISMILWHSFGIVKEGIPI